MVSISSFRQVLLLGCEADDDLADGLQALLPAAELDPLATSEIGGLLAGQACDLLVVRCNRIGLADLRLVEGIGRSRADLILLLVVGDRGLAGAEPLLTLPGSRLLPEPWTLSGLRGILGLQRPEPRPRAAQETLPDQEFLAGMVEGLRDPLASLSGYLQLLRGEDAEEAGVLLDPALDSARELDRILDTLHLASGSGKRDQQEIQLQDAARSAILHAGREGRSPELLWSGDARVLGDPRVLQAALYASRLYLERFGFGEELTLDVRQDPHALELAWESAPSADAADAGLTPPPAFLPTLLRQLARQIRTEAVIDLFGDVVPIRAGLRWRQFMTTRA